MDKEKAEMLSSTRAQALYLWTGISLAMTLYYGASQVVFVRSKPLPSSKLEWTISILGIITFIFGLLFYRNYMALRKNRILKMPLRDRKQSVLIASVLQFVLFQTLGLYGVLLSVWSQSRLKAIPFVLFAYIGFYTCFPRKGKFDEFFQ